MCLLVILFTHGINFAEDVKKNNFKEERSEYIPTENSLKIKSPSDKSKIFTDELINRIKPGLRKKLGSTGISKISI